jgi:hypothetical protein
MISFSCKTPLSYALIHWKRYTGSLIQAINHIFSPARGFPQMLLC